MRHPLLPALLLLPLACGGSGQKDSATPATGPAPGTATGPTTGTPTGTVTTDCDGDGYSDAIEDALGSDPCDLASGPGDVTDLLLVIGREDTTYLDHTRPVPPVDVVFAFDTTGSMGGEISELQDGVLTEVVTPLGAALGDVGFGLATYRDVPVDPFGDPGDVPFTLVQRVTTDPASLEAAVDSMAAGGGGDPPESGYEALFQAATGVGGTSWSGGAIPTFDPAMGLVPGVADGTVGGAGFRDGALHVIVRITDAVSHEPIDYGASVTGAHSRADAVGALQSLGIAVIGVAGLGATTEAREVALDTGALVPACAFQSACGPDQCCTGLLGSGQAPTGGHCPLAFEMDDQGTELTGAIALAVETLVEMDGETVGLRVVRDEAEYAASGIDTSCFVAPVTHTGETTTFGCGPAPAPADLDGDGVNESVTNLPVGNSARFDLEPIDCVPGTDAVQVFTATLEVVADSVRVVGSRELTVVVPPASS